MPSPFDALDAAVQTAIDQTFGEGIRIEPMLSGDYAKAPDPERPARSCRATISRAPGAKATNFPSTNRKSSDLAVSPTEAWIDRAAYAALGYPIRRGDFIVLTEAAGSPRFEVAAAHRGDYGDVTLPLISLSPAEE